MLSSRVFNQTAFGSLGRLVGAHSRRLLSAENYDARKELELLERPTIPVDSPLRAIDIEKLTIQRTPNPKPCPPVDTLVWGEVFSDICLRYEKEISLIDFLF